MTNLAFLPVPSVQERMVVELAADTNFQAYEHTAEEIAQVVAGLAKIAATPAIEYIATPADVAAVAQLVAACLGLEDYEAAGSMAQALREQQLLIAS